MTELHVTEEQVRQEHMREIKVARHWIYLFAVLIGGFLLMVALMALLGAAS